MDSGTLSTVVICILLGLICIFAVRSYIKKLKSGCCGSGGDAEKKIRPADKNISHYPYAYQIGIEGMHCKNCALRIENAFHEREGYLAAVNFRQNTAVVRAKHPVSEQDVRQIVQRAGYQVTNVVQAIKSVL